MPFFDLKKMREKYLFKKSLFKIKRKVFKEQN